MATEPQQSEGEPRGFGPHSRGRAGENAHEQGWGLNIEQRKRESTQPQNTDGGNDYEYGARDFGDRPVNTQIAPQRTGRTQNRSPRSRKAA